MASIFWVFLTFLPEITPRIIVKLPDPCLLVIRIVGNKKVKVDHPAKPHDPWLHPDQENSIQPHPVKKAMVLRRQPDQYPPGNKSRYRQPVPYQKPTSSSKG
jgi:hypothetical protein